MEVHPDGERVLFGESEIQSKVRDLASKISNDYNGKDILVICSLKGAFIFTADLVRSITVPVRMDFMALSSYGTSANSSGAVRILKDLDYDIQGRDVLIVEDIVDTGLTIKYLMENLRARKPNSLKVCALLDKPARRKVHVEADYTGFIIDDHFVVGYGLDYSEKYRNLRYIMVLRPEVYRG